MASFEAPAPWQHPRFAAAAGLRATGQGILETKLNKEKGEKKTVLCKQGLLFLATGNHISATLLNDSQIFHTSPSVPGVSCLRVVTGSLQARIKRTLV